MKGAMYATNQKNIAGMTFDGLQYEKSSKSRIDG